MQGRAATAYSGQLDNAVWKVEFEQQAKWANPLMGWTSTADPLDNVGRAGLVFQTKEAALSYCAKYGIEAEVREPHLPERVRARRFASYSDNFSMARGGQPEIPPNPNPFARKAGARGGGRRRPRRARRGGRPPRSSRSGRGAD